MAIRHDVVENCVGEDINASISTIKQRNAGFHQVNVKIKTKISILISKSGDVNILTKFYIKLLIHIK